MRSTNSTYEKEHLGSYLSTFIQEGFDLKYNGTYNWYGPWEQHMRKIISVFLLKGGIGILEWGYNFDFLPEIKSNRLQYFRTEKQVKAQLQDMPKPFIEMAPRKQWEGYLMPQSVGDTIYYMEKKNSLTRLFHAIAKNDTSYDSKRKIRAAWEKTKPEIQDFFDRIYSLETILTELDIRIERKQSAGTLDYYSLLSPESLYLKAFILARLGEERMAVECIEKTEMFKHASEDNQNRLIDKLKELQHDSGLRPAHY